MPLSSPSSSPESASPARLRAWRPWLLATLLAAIGIALRAIAQPVLGDQLPFVLAFPVTVVVALLWGTGPGLLAGALCALAVVIPFIPPDLSTDRPMQIGAFTVSAIIICLVCGQFGARVQTQRSSWPAAPADTALTIWLRAVLWGALLVPTVSFAAAVWWGYERAYQQAVDTVSHASALALQHAERTFAIAAEIGERANAASTGPEKVVREQEAEIHQRLSDMAAGLPSVVNLSVWNAQGASLVRSDLFPVDPSNSIADRRYFIQQREHPSALGISEVLLGRQTGRTLLNTSTTRTTADGAFDGIVNVSLSPNYFIDYYKSLVTEAPNLASFALVRTDGALLARWPAAPDGRTTVRPDSLAMQQIHAGVDSGVGVLPQRDGREARLASFRRVTGYPLYVTAGVSKSAMLAGWLRFVALLAAVMVPTTLGLVYVSWVALRKTHMEQVVSVELREEIRRRAKAEQAILQNQKLEALSQLTGGVAHDFNNLLTIVSSSLHVHRRRHPALADEKQLESMSRAIKSGVRLTRQLLSFSRRQALRPERIALQQWLPATEDLIRSTLGRSVELSVDVARDVLPIDVDTAELELALINTALNAQHAMPSGGVLRIAARNVAKAPGGNSPMVLISIEDNGSGIAPELLGRVFEPFFTTKAAGKGTGLGLSQVYGLCAQAGGQAVVDSSVGRGTTIGLYFPPATESVVEAGAPLETAPNTLDGHVLLVEDNDDVATATESLLIAAGLRVTRVPSADAAIATLAANDSRLDVVLSDISMPGSMDGIELAFRLKSDHPSLPVLLTTGYAERIGDAMAGGFRVLAKPAAADELLSELSALLPARA